MNHWVILIILFTDWPKAKTIDYQARLHPRKVARSRRARSLLSRSYRPDLVCVPALSGVLMMGPLRSQLHSLRNIETNRIQHLTRPRSSYEYSPSSCSWELLCFCKNSLTAHYQRQQSDLWDPRVRRLQRKVKILSLISILTAYVHIRWLGTQDRI